MHPRRVFAITLRQFYLIRGSLSRLVPMLVWVAVDMVLWGFMSRYLTTISSEGMNFTKILLGAVLLWDFFSRVMYGVTMALFEDVWSRNFLNVFATPLLVTEYLGGLVLTSVATSSIGLAVMLAISTGAFGLSIFSYGAALFPFILILFMFGVALGIFGSAIILWFGPSAEWFIWPIPPLLSPFVGVFYPLATLPDWMQAVSFLLPPAYVFESVRAITSGAGFSWGHLLTGVALCIVYLLLAALAFSKTYQRAVTTGLLARYSAESVS